MQSFFPSLGTMFLCVRLRNGVCLFYLWANTISGCFLKDVQTAVIPNKHLTLNGGTSSPGHYPLVHLLAHPDYTNTHTDAQKVCACWGDGGGWMGSLFGRRGGRRGNHWYLFRNAGQCMCVLTLTWLWGSQRLWRNALGGRWGGGGGEAAKL